MKSFCAYFAYGGWNRRVYLEKTILTCVYELEKILIDLTTRAQNNWPSYPVQAKVRADWSMVKPWLTTVYSGSSSGFYVSPLFWL